jgi:hypothetical protein
MNPMTPAVRTRLSPGDALDAIVDAHNSVVGGDPSDECLEILGAHSALETAQWQAMWNNNFGNIRGSFFGAWTSFRAGEIEDGHEVILEPGPDNMFRAYPNRVVGAKDFLAFIAIASHPPEPNRYAMAWEAAQNGDAAGYVYGLKQGGYFTANEDRYLKALRSEETFLAHLPFFAETLRPHVAARKSFQLSLPPPIR